MILVTVGGQLPFDRLVRAVDAWAADHEDVEVFAQIGETDYRPEHMRWTAFLEPQAFQERFRAATVIVSHAGMGTIIGALEAGKPVVVLPRRHALGEQRNDHQLATARHLRERPGVIVAMDEEELAARLAGIEDLGPLERRLEGASPELLAALRAFVEEAPRRRR